MWNIGCSVECSVSLRWLMVIVIELMRNGMLLLMILIIVWLEC